MARIAAFVDGRAFHPGVVPETCAHAGLAVTPGHLSEDAFILGHRGNVASLHIADAGGQLVADAFQYGHRMGGLTVVDAPHHRGVGGIGTHDDDLGRVFLQGQRVVLVVQQHHLLACHGQRQVLVSLAGDDALGYAGPFDEGVGIEITQVEPCLEQLRDATVDLLLRDGAGLDGLGQCLIVAATFEVGTAEDGLGGGCPGIGRDAMGARHPEIADGSAVTHHQSSEAPLVAEDLAQQFVAAAAGLALEALIGAHHLLDAADLHEVLEGGEVGLPQVAGRQVLDVEMVAGLFRSAVDGKVLSTGIELRILRDCRLIPSL